LQAEDEATFTRLPILDDSAQTIARRVRNRAHPWTFRLIGTPDNADADITAGFEAPQLG
jgi:hypothetical protein